MPQIINNVSVIYQLAYFWVKYRLMSALDRITAAAVATAVSSKRSSIAMVARLPLLLLAPRCYKLRSCLAMNLIERLRQENWPPIMEQ